MNRAQRWLVRISTLLAGGTGCVYGFMKYLMKPADEWAVVNHPWQPHLQHLHVLAGPLLIFAVAYIWREHVGTRVARETRRGRLMGAVMRYGFLPMVASGLLYQTVVAESWRQRLGVSHLVLGLIWLGATTVHFVGAHLSRPNPVDDALSPIGDITWEPVLVATDRQATLKSGALSGPAGSAAGLEIVAEEQ